MPAYCGWTIGGAILAPIVVMGFASRGDATAGSVRYFSIAMIVIGLAAAIAGKLRGGWWRRTSPPGVLPEVVGWLVAFSAAFYIAMAVEARLGPNIPLFGAYVDSRLLGLGIAGAVFGFMGGTVTALRWAADTRRPGLAAVAVGWAATLATFVGVYVGVAGGYLAMLFLRSEYGGAVVGGAVGGALGGGLGEVALWLGIGQLDEDLQNKKPGGS